MKEEKKKRWEEVITSIDLTHNSRKAWQTIRKLSNDPTSPNLPCLVNSNQVAHHLLVNGQGTMRTKPKCHALQTVVGKPSLVSAFSEDEYRKGIAALKNNKAAGIDDILVEQLKNLGPNAHKWLHTMLNTCFIENKIVEWNRTKLENTPHPKYLGVTLDRTLSYKEHMHNTKMKVATRKQSTKKVVQIEMGSKRKYHKNNSIGIMLFCG